VWPGPPAGLLRTVSRSLPGFLCEIRHLLFFAWGGSGGGGCATGTVDVQFKREPDVEKSGCRKPRMI
jgi:hypothetical protein